MSKRICLCCGKEIEEEGLWHHRCIKNFFGSDELPEIQLNVEELEKLAIEQIDSHKGVAGVQEKLSLHLELAAQKRPRLTIVGFPSGYILKPQSSTYKRLPEFEQTAMLLADACQIPVVPHGLIPVNGDELAYITKRIDRVGTNKVHMEDFCQASGNVTADKYRSSYEECAQLIDRYSSRALLDKTRFFQCLYFNFLIGNSDCHLKNFSFLMDGKGNLSLSPFYDILPTKIILPSDHEDLGLLLDGRKTNLRGGSFTAFANSIGIPELAQKKIMASIDQKHEEMCQIIDGSSLDQNSKSEWKKMIASGIKRSKKP